MLRLDVSVIGKVKLKYVTEDLRRVWPAPAYHNATRSLPTTNASLSCFTGREPTALSTVC